MSLSTHLYAFLWVNLGVKLLCHRYPCIFNFRRCHLSYPSPPCLTSGRVGRGMRVVIFPHHLALLVFSIFTILMGVAGEYFVVLIYIYLYT